MTYRQTCSKAANGGLEYNVNWEGKIDPIAVCPDRRDAVKIVDALNNSPRTCCGPVSNGWIPVAEELPDDDALVLIHTDNETICMAAHNNGHWWDHENFVIRSEVTHWAEPTPPIQ